MFKNCAAIDFTVKGEVENFHKALNRLDLEIQAKKLLAKPQTADIKYSDLIEHPVFDPSEAQLEIGKVQYANTALTLEIIEHLCKNEVISDYNQRITILKKVAELLIQNRYDYIALAIRETGKTWTEADLDLVEAVDFLNYYASCAEEYKVSKLTQELLGEKNILKHRARGIVAVISPWNFPIAIPCGMLAAAFVTGNKVIFKPAEQSSLTAAKLYNDFLTAGANPADIIFLPGKGEEVGATLCSNPNVHMICFTGSKAVGCEIYKVAANTSQKYMKKVITEMGSKNPIIIDDGADLDEAIPAILYSSFAFAGQKCSSCSRLIVIGDLEHLLQRLKNALGDLIISKAKDPSSYLGPVIDLESKQRIESIISNTKDAELIYRRELSDDLKKASFVAPTIFKVNNLMSAIWTEEIFGPVLAVTSANSIEAAIKIANNTDYALTAGIFSRSPASIQYFVDRIKAGNIYINRGCTGAVVERQPFGGFGMSGTGPKAGGKQYLLHFMDEVLVCENTMRKGFTPELG